MCWFDSPHKLKLELNSLALLAPRSGALHSADQVGNEVPLRLVAVSAPSAAAAALSAERYGRYGVYWASGDGSNIDEEKEEAELQLAAFGAAAQFSSTGAMNQNHAHDQFKEFFARLQKEPLLDYLRVFGGESFISGRDGSGCWADFGDCHFIIPEITYVDRSRHSTTAASDRAEAYPAFFLMVITDNHAKNSERLAFIEDLCKRRESLSIPEQAQGRTATLSVVEERSSLTRGEWAASVDSIKAEIFSGQVEKIVTARRVTLELSDVPQLPLILTRLASSAPRCTRFSFRIGSRVFLAATPERLIRKRGLLVRTEALAGSVSVAAIDAESKLLGSAKDRQEHEFVVGAIRSALEPLCSELKADEIPQVRRLKHVLHLQTPISGMLKAPLHIMQLVAHLHPTPAVGGLPQAKALEWIASHEKSERGWYAAPFGWFDSKGNGEFRVSLRAALLNENKVHLFAGAGIVRDSDAASEFAETELKFSSIREALGLIEITQ